MSDWTYLAGTDGMESPIYYFSKIGERKAQFVVADPDPCFDIERLVTALNLYDSMNSGVLALPDPPQTQYDILFTPARKPRPSRRKT